MFKVLSVAKNRLKPESVPLFIRQSESYILMYLYDACGVALM